MLFALLINTPLEQRKTLGLGAAQWWKWAELLASGSPGITLSVVPEAVSAHSATHFSYGNTSKAYRPKAVQKPAFLHKGPAPEPDLATPGGAPAPKTGAMHSWNSGPAPLVTLPAAVDGDVNPEGWLTYTRKVPIFFWCLFDTETWLLAD